jgi:hypothetical protein
MPVTKLRRDDGGAVTIDLEAGGFALLRLHGLFGSLLTGRGGPLLEARPNPARGEAQFALTRLAEDARLEVLDAAGRRVWSKELSAGETTLTWRGERDGGGVARAGAYFVRVEDRRGTAALRFVWLGP